MVFRHIIAQYLDCPTYGIMNGATKHQKIVFGLLPPRRLLIGNKIHPKQKLQQKPNKQKPAARWWWHPRGRNTLRTTIMVIAKGTCGRLYVLPLPWQISVRFFTHLKLIISLFDLMTIQITHHHVNRIKNRSVILYRHHAIRPANVRMWLFVGLQWSGLHQCIKSGRCHNRPLQAGSDMGKRQTWN